MLPTVLTEGEFSQFRFWLDDEVQDGLFYEGEMFCRLFTVSTTYRAQLYHYACQCCKQESIVVTLAESHASLWLSLRSPNLSQFKASAMDHSSLEDVAELSLESSKSSKDQSQQHTDDNPSGSSKSSKSSEDRFQQYIADTP